MFLGRQSPIIYMQRMQKTDIVCSYVDRFLLLIMTAMSVAIMNSGTMIDDGNSGITHVPLIWTMLELQL